MAHLVRCQESRSVAFLKAVLVSDIMLHMKMCNVWTYVTHEYEICSIRAYGTCEKNYVRTYVTHGNIMFLVPKIAMYDNVICPNLYYPRKCDVVYPN